ncbi:NmrA family protein [Apiospora arundinis]|uniref:NmrA family protein n=1 Tax=Apiospora arundinis TaxID=335852 RepID=A0ABR2I4C7_9PEZI
MSIGKLLVLGASSPTGKLILKRALEFGWSVTVYGRGTLPEHAGNADVRTVQGQLDDEENLLAAISGQDVIISVLGPSIPLPISTSSLGVKRIIALSTYSVVDPRDKPNFLRWVITTALWALAHEIWKTVVDIAAFFDAEGGDDIDWTLFRVGYLANGPPM